MSNIPLTWQVLYLFVSCEKVRVNSPYIILDSPIIQSTITTQHIDEWHYESIYNQIIISLPLLRISSMSPIAIQKEEK